NLWRMIVAHYCLESIARNVTQWSIGDENAVQPISRQRGPALGNRMPDLALSGIYALTIQSFGNRHGAVGFAISGMLLIPLVAVEATQAYQSVNLFGIGTRRCG